MFERVKLRFASRTIASRRCAVSDASLPTVSHASSPFGPMQCLVATTSRSLTSHVALTPQNWPASGLQTRKRPLGFTPTTEPTSPHR